jgi:hypothetical protein
LGDLLIGNANSSQDSHCIQLINTTEQCHNVRFSKVKYDDIAPLDCLDTAKMVHDIHTIEMIHARLPNAIFPLIIDDIQVFGAQYGPMIDHRNEEARSRYLSSVVLNYGRRTVSLQESLSFRIYFLFSTPFRPLVGHQWLPGWVRHSRAPIYAICRACDMFWWWRSYSVCFCMLEVLDGMQHVLIVLEVVLCKTVYSASTHHCSVRLKKCTEPTHV